ncbi:hypothetical protein TW95_gp0491 [Pandoravirus inopinatum]|uniref:Uncharacterized protein n=1 Tax=Pandoravirus inopinatum TaxID=1605721 RepID=A0A0B5J679_9VIRU|nr:hypothetical protein TW95_gp0491 [Pandoravirus inopinatum]AJF97225.1 hypothetical protein [Pandoravirus inopinatum]
MTVGRRMAWRGPQQAAPVGNEPLEHVEVTSRRGLVACALIPCTSVGARPLQHGKVAAAGCGTTSLGVPWTTASSEPLKSRQISTTGYYGARPSILWAARV